MPPSKPNGVLMVIVPPDEMTMFLATTRPSPKPQLLPVMNDSKSRSRMAAGVPGPLSSITKTDDACSLSSRSVTVFRSVVRWARCAFKALDTIPNKTEAIAAWSAKTGNSAALPVVKSRSISVWPARARPRSSSKRDHLERCS